MTTDITQAETPIPLAPESGRFKRYMLHGLLPSHCSLTCDKHTYLVTLQCPDEHGVLYITEQQHFTLSEFDMLVYLLETYPTDFVPMFELLSVQSGRRVSVCQQEIHVAWMDGEIDEVVRPVRNLMSRTRQKLRHFGLDARSILNTGYKLMLDNTRRR